MDYGILVDSQHGFRAKRSTETQLQLATVHDIAYAVQCNNSVSLAILDFSQATAFDKVSHQRLLSKLDNYRIRGPSHSWLSSFLTQRMQMVVCDGASSSAKKVTFGVPQGTVLGLSLFLLYINDLPSKLQCTVRLFADDCLLCVILVNPTSDAQLLSIQNDLYKLEEWQNLWQMQFNPKKCSTMCITLKKHLPPINFRFCGQILENVTSHPYLGVQLHSKLCWKEHIEFVVKSANKILGLIKRNVRFCDESVKLTLYKNVSKT